MNRREFLDKLVRRSVGFGALVKGVEASAQNPPCVLYNGTGCSTLDYVNGLDREERAVLVDGKVVKKTYVVFKPRVKVTGEQVEWPVEASHVEHQNAYIDPKFRKGPICIKLCKDVDGVTTWAEPAWGKDASWWVYCPEG